MCDIIRFTLGRLVSAGRCAQEGAAASNSGYHDGPPVVDFAESDPNDNNAREFSVEKFMERQKVIALIIKSFNRQQLAIKFGDALTDTQRYRKTILLGQAWS